MLTEKELKWPENLDNALLLCNIQAEKLNDGFPLFLQTATKEELSEAIEETIIRYKDELDEFITDEYRENKALSWETANKISWKFFQWLMVNFNKNVYNFSDFEKFAKELSIQTSEVVIFFDYEPEEIEEVVQYKTVEELKEETDYRIMYCNLYDYAVSTQLDFAVDMLPRQLHKYVKFYDKDKKRIETHALKPDKLTQYEEDEIKALTGIKLY